MFRTHLWIGCFWSAFSIIQLLPTTKVTQLLSGDQNLWYIRCLPKKFMQIVNVDDDKDDREMFCMAIRKIDPAIECIQVESGEDAIDLLLTSKVAPDFIFMDINMPLMNGYECVREIYQFPNLKNASIIMFSSTFNPRDQVEFGVLGLKFLLKTSSITSLVGSIKELIQANLVEEKRKR